MENDRKKKRSQSCYDKKVKKIQKWYAHLLKERETDGVNKKTKRVPTRKELKSLDYYIEKIKKPRGE